MPSKRVQGIATRLDKLHSRMEAQLEELGVLISDLNDEMVEGVATRINPSRPKKKARETTYDPNSR